MDLTLLARFADTVRSASTAEIQADLTLGGRLVLDRQGELTVSYAPFDHVNPAARIVLVGITPGRQQAVNALVEAQRQLRAGAPLETVARAAKETASFSGALRPNLVALLDAFRIHEVLGIAGCASLFGADRPLVHYTSALRYPVFRNGRDYPGDGAMLRHPLLTGLVRRHLVSELQALPDALLVPLGGKVAAVLDQLARDGRLDPKRILGGLQHPSGSNAERIAYQLGRKPRERLSVKVDPAKIDAASTSLRIKVDWLLRQP
jgi:hypothetical protein